MDFLTSKDFMNITIFDENLLHSLNLYSSNENIYGIFEPFSLTPRNFSNVNLKIFLQFSLSTFAQTSCPTQCYQNNRICFYAFRTLTGKGFPAHLAFLSYPPVVGNHQVVCPFHGGDFLVFYLDHNCLDQELAPSPSCSNHSLY